MRRALFSLIASAGILAAQGNPDWHRPFPEFRIAGNIYWVGTADLAVYLVKTPAGDILINTDFDQDVPLIQKSIEQTGAKISDVKIILVSHAHDDHVAGTAALKKLTGAKLMVMQPDVAEIESGGQGDFQYQSHWTPVKVDRVLHDGDTVKLGGTTLVAHLTPGHTKGCTTWTTTVTENSRPLNVVIIGSPNVNPGYKLVVNDKYPDIVRDYEKTFAVLKSLPCDVFLGAHGAYFGLKAKYEKYKAGDTNAFIDPQGYKAYVSERESAFRRELARQSAQR
ncbi:MAG TPA: subclass B3 metallo-beta-lactamase [Bryobacteraceae bacterium]|nr:subclass B3 metallo-beta-lactamase [Bryobacteraceae bacterium]